MLCQITGNCQSFFRNDAVGFLHKEMFYVKVFALVENWEEFASLKENIVVALLLPPSANYNTNYKIIKHRHETKNVRNFHVNLLLLMDSYFHVFPHEKSQNNSE